MREYEVRANGPFSARSGGGEYETSFFGGPITSVGGRIADVKSMPTVDRKASGKEALQGYVVRYNKPHVFKGAVDVFVKGSFDASLASRKRIEFWIDHKSGTEMASTDDDLELMSDETGLAFRLKNPPTPLIAEVRSRRITAMSAGSRTLRQEYKEVGGERVRFILEADLVEISMVKAGAVKQAFIDVVDTKGSSLRDDVKAGRVLADGAHVALMRALQRLKD
ncbi:HK97 family phage prohead protease [Phyllobacterium bourgognense]|uniref:HK97 family phage prohead protease n=1 Tax=Phyllobacterium bourgognense TaxID=314236 RepID=A0A368YPT2_9HYPH|nr:HK97 family phage prohead protease [Phyllobacterium bourgognense]RCW80927.1 HK97 family phage prohead protease [Phyllobacterium bourgognense]